MTVSPSERIKGKKNDCVDGKSEINSQEKPRVEKQRQFSQTLGQSNGTTGVDNGGVEASI
ncbi:hypothetical protein BG74_00625 [Sodalis-like endosymbiont of Proechinophthirus fluctus]|uniref:hypothetical protein n=1 Tax=Sodalis-like endosymbiont of Proechinophthirus fluctus TaxID=1462730 RepID=UPI0007A8A0ED|nr:hypothetical protein [Sodalis-like endosymbiont of Proechinophthirus fluctus]KYP97785.1 hypothetical protein BG74_00625 [Sodalis-like endosymbiont of Proechinophthirus fluctus]